MIVAGSASQALAAALAAETDHALGHVEYERFPDGEGIVRVPERVDEVVVVASTTSDEALVELLQLQDAVREAGASHVTTILPYMGYARQDEAFEAGEPVSARAVAKAVSTGTDRVLVVDPHEEAICDFFDVPAAAVEAAGRLAEPLPDDLADPVFCSPDEGAVALAEAARDAYGSGTADFFEKTRHSSTEVEIEPRDAAVAGRDVVLVDDIVATGGTMSEAVEVLADRDAARVFVTCVHPLLVGNARLKLERAGVAAIHATDAIERSVSSVSVAPLLAERL
ncbi:ribose-phosphate diphosphokinase [Halobacteriales archaeon Cl-PHB]